MKLETRQDAYTSLKKLGANNTRLVWTDGSTQTVDKAETTPSNLVVKNVPMGANAAVIIFHGTNASPENKTITFEIYGWRAGGPAEWICNGGAVLGTHRVAAGTDTEMYADTIAITTQTWVDTVTVADSGNNRIAKLAFDMYGLAGIACACWGGTATTNGAKVSFV